MNALTQILRTRKISKCWSRVESALRQQAKMAAEAESSRVMADFYTDRVKSIDPYQDHWGFATARHKQAEHHDDLTQYRKLRDEAAARVAAEKARHVQLYSEPSTTGKGHTP